MHANENLSRLTPLALIASASALLLTGCPQEGVVCSEGLSRCGNDCADLQADSRNCGACGSSCQPGQVCAGGQCACQAGSVLCEGSCVVTATNPKYCGTAPDGGLCGVACGANEVCEGGLCKVACELGTSTVCGQSCVDTQSDPNHCGRCENACENAQSCRKGLCTYDVVVACATTGQVAGLQAQSDFLGPRESLGSSPAALGTLGEVLLSADGLDNRLYQARLSSEGGRAFRNLPGDPATGSGPNHLLVDDPYVYVANAIGGSLQVLQRGAADGGAEDGGLGLATIAELPLGANSYPEAIAQIGTSLYVPLYGGFGATAAAAGQKVVKIDVADRKSPSVVDTFDLSGLDLKPFDGGSPVPRPFAVAVHRGAVYVALNNLNPDTYVPEGPGLLARIDPATRAVTTIDLGAERCLNPVWLESDGERLYVSCKGKVEYDSNWAVSGVEKTGIVLVDSDQPTGSWSVSCQPDAGAYDPDAGTGCLPVSSGRLAVQDGRVYLGDENGGRLFVLERVGDALAERRGFAGDAGAPIQACPVGPLGYSNVSHVLAVP